MSNDWKNYWKKVISDEERLVIDVSTYDGISIGQLFPLTEKSLDNDFIINALTSWRKKYIKFFFTEFEPKNLRTIAWLEKTVLKNDNQMLFLIYCEGCLIGQYGFKNLTEKTVLMDNLIRGETGGHPKLIERSMMALISWLFMNFNIDNVTGSILSDNPSAMIVNKAVGLEYKSEEKCKLPDGRYSRDIILTRENWESKKLIWWN